MSLTSFEFLALIAIGVFVYYLIPKKWQWIELLILSLVFYFETGIPYTIVYLLISVATAYLSTMWMAHTKYTEASKGIFAVTVAAVAVNAGIWFVLKCRELWMLPLCVLGIEDTRVGLHLVAALGMGYYTLQIIGYIIDCYWGNAIPQKNPFKLFLFASYFPQMITGPISRYSQLESLYESHRFEYHNIAFGAQRILWGFVKKLVLAERVGMIVTAITSAPDVYRGFYSWIAILLYPIQMYADFSGCMDIVIGVSELFGIRLAENFNNPFFSRTSQEFWQRWHITLGAWAKDYLLFPLLKSDPMVYFGKAVRKRFGRNRGKYFVNLVGMFVLWMGIGIWHGGVRYIVGVSLWYWVILMLGELLSPAFVRLTDAMSIKTQSFAWHVFQSLRTYLIYSVGAVFFSNGIMKGIKLLADALKVMLVHEYANPWIFFDDSILETGVTYSDINIIIVSMVMLLVAGVLRERYGYARSWMEKQSFIFRWVVWIFLFIFVLIFGKYGPGYSAAEFIYKGF